MRSLLLPSVTLIGIVAICARCGGASFILAIPDAGDGSSDSGANGGDSGASPVSGEVGSSVGGDPDSGPRVRDSGRGQGATEAGSASAVGDAAAGDGGFSDANVGDGSDLARGDAGLGDSGDASGGDTGSGGTCTPPCAASRACCGGTCINPSNDPYNCGKCGTKCTSPNSLCSAGSCQAAPCGTGLGCNSSETCCGAVCCTSGQLCCLVGGLSTVVQCVTPTSAQPTCPSVAPASG